MSYSLQQSIAKETITILWGERNFAVNRRTNTTKRKVMIQAKIYRQFQRYFHISKLHTTTLPKFDTVLQTEAPRGVCVPGSPLFPELFLTVPLKEMTSFSLEYTLILSSLEKFAHIPMFPLIKTASSLVPHNPWGPSHTFRTRFLGPIISAKKN